MRRRTLLLGTASVALLCLSKVARATSALAAQNTITVRSSKAVANHPIQIGRVFRKGEIADEPSVVGVNLQGKVMTRWDDGSVQHWIGCWIQNGTGTLRFANAKPSPAASCDISGMGLDVTIEFTKDGVTKVASAQKMLADVSYKTWFAGPIAKALILADHTTKKYDVSFDGIRVIRPFFYATFWPSLGLIRCRVGAEICDTETLGEVAYSVAIKVNGNAVFSQGTVAHRPFTRWSREFWIGGTPNPDVEVDHDFGYLISTKLVPNYDQRIANYFNDARCAGALTYMHSKDYSLYGPGEWRTKMEDAGGRGDIGPLPVWALNYLYTFDRRFLAVLTGQGEQAGAWQMNCREGKRGRFFDDAKTIDAIGYPVSGIARPMAWIMPPSAQPRNPDTIAMRGGISATLTGSIASDGKTLTVEAVNPGGYVLAGDYLTSNGGSSFGVPTILSQTSGTPGGPGNYLIQKAKPMPHGTAMKTRTLWQQAGGAGGAHQPDPYSVLYMLTGEYYWLEQMQLWACTQIVRYNPGTAGYSKGGGAGTSGVILDELRGKAWVTRNRWLAWLFSPDADPVKGYLGKRLQEAVGYLCGRMHLTGTKFEGTPAYVKGTSAWPANGLGEIQCTIGNNQYRFPPWENAFLISTLGRMEESGYSDVTQLLDAVGSAPIGIFMEPGLPHEWLAGYYLVSSDTNKEFFGNWRQVINATRGRIPNPLKNGSQNDDYASQACMAASFLVGRIGGQAMRDWLAANWYEPYIADYGKHYANYAIVPRR
jgi:hypothetical protein